MYPNPQHLWATIICLHRYSRFYIQWVNWKMGTLKLNSQRNVKYLIYCLALIFFWDKKYIMKYGWVPDSFILFLEFFAPSIYQGITYLDNLFCFHIILQSLKYVKNTEYYNILMPGNRSGSLLLLTLLLRELISVFSSMKWV